MNCEGVSGLWKDELKRLKTPEARSLGFRVSVRSEYILIPGHFGLTPNLHTENGSDWGERLDIAFSIGFAEICLEHAWTYRPR